MRPPGWRHCKKRGPGEGAPADSRVLMKRVAFPPPPPARAVGRLGGDLSPFIASGLGA